MSLDSKMNEVFIARTNRHVDLVKKYGFRIYNLDPVGYEDLAIRLQDHDASKFKNPELVPYVYITWDYKCKDEGVPFNVPQNIKDKMNSATNYHITHNMHHPEYYSPVKTSLINRDDRDAVPDTMVDATKMPKVSIAEMVADWCAMSEEKGNNTPKQWADKVVNKRWKFTPSQVKLIYTLIDKVWS